MNPAEWEQLRWDKRGVHRPQVDDLGGAPVATHDYACPTCWNGGYVNHAVLDLNTGKFGPCWACRSLGWRITRRTRWESRWRFLRRKPWYLVTHPSWWLRDGHAETL